MQIAKVTAIPMSAPVPNERRHRTDLGTKVKSDATLIRVETDSGLTGIGAALGSPPIVAAIVEHELSAEVVGEDPMFSERIYEKMYNGSRSTPALQRGVAQADESRRHHGSDCWRRHRGVGCEVAGARYSALPGAWCRA
jgi:L-alanine-DL-glutamate epimerase-like enolase superfamily enzyme